MFILSICGRYVNDTYSMEWKTKSKDVVDKYCFFAHLIGTLYIIIVPFAYNVPISKLNYAISTHFGKVIPWTVFCDGEKLNATTSLCPDANRTFEINQPTGDLRLSTVSLYGLAISFSAVSCLVHGCFWAKSKYVADNPKIKNAVRLAVDYGISASIMLALINTLWGANNIAGVIVAPITLFLLLVASACLLYSAEGKRSQGSVPNHNVKIKFLVLCGLYTVALSPTIYAVIYSVIQKPEVWQGQAPPYVAVFAFLVMLTFTSFLVPYIWQLFYAKDVDVLYGVLSITAKWSLHMLLTFGLINQIKMTNGDSSEINVLQNGIIAVALVGTAGGILSVYLNPCTCCLTSKRTDLLLG